MSDKLIDKLAEVGSQLTESELPPVHDLRRAVGALIYLAENGDDSLSDQALEDLRQRQIPEQQQQMNDAADNRTRVETRSLNEKDEEIAELKRQLADAQGETRGVPS